jgi:quinone-modifying oxidoreductase subunit QmoC
MVLAMVAGLFGAALHLLSLPGPYSQLNPIKWVANTAGVALVVGSLLMIKERLSDY